MRKVPSTFRHLVDKFCSGQVYVPTVPPRTIQEGHPGVAKYFNPLFVSFFVGATTPPLTEQKNIL